jgi:putative methionine-R-sulfoxide reductase with GAF domain
VPRLLYVEDNEMNRDMLSRRFRSARGSALMLLVWAGWIVVEGSLLKLEYWQHATAHLQSPGAEGVSRAEVELVD